MLQTGVPITFRDAKKFATMAKSTYLNETPRKRANFERFALKLVDKSLPSIILHHIGEQAADVAKNTYSISFSDCLHIAKEIAQRSSDNDYLYPKINYMYDYMNSNEAKFSLKGQTLSSVMKHFGVHSHAIMNHQGAIACEIYSQIRVRVSNMLVDRDAKA